MNLIQDPILWRGVERLLIAFAGVLFGIMGYRLFAMGLLKGRGQLDARSRFFQIVLSGTGPGLFFMIAGAIILLLSIFKGGAESRPAAPETTPVSASDSLVKDNEPLVSDNEEGLQTRVYVLPEIRRLQGITEKDSSGPSPILESETSAAEAPSVVTGQERKIADGHHFGCTERQYFEKLVRYAINEENDALSQAIAEGISTKECIVFKTGEAVYITDTAIAAGLVEVRRKGETRGYWAILQAVR